MKADKGPLLHLLMVHDLDNAVDWGENYVYLYAKEG